MTPSRPAPRAPEPREVAPASGSRRDEVVRRILQADDFPALSEVMSDLMASLGNEEASVQRLANLVLRDYALTVKVIRTANTAHYNRSGKPVQSATHAMMLLGARTVRELASGLLLFEHYRTRSPGLKELMLLSLLSASHARDAAARRGVADPETAQLCALFRNLGEVLVAGHLPKDYAAVLRETERRRQAGESATARAAAARQVLGCAFEDVGMAIARHWGMPDSVRRGMVATGAPGEEPLSVLAAFGHDLSAAIYRDESPGARDAVQHVLSKYGGRLDLSRAVLAEIADAALTETREIFAAARVRLDDLKLERQISAALSESPAEPTRAGAPAAGAVRTDGAPSPEPGALARTPADGVAAVTAAGAEVDETSELRARLLAALEAAVPDVATYDLSQLAMVALEAVLRGAPADRAVFCVPDARVTELRPRLALGPDVEALRTRFRVPLGAAHGHAGPTLLRGDEIVLDAGSRMASSDAHLLRMLGAGGAVLLPVTVDGTTIGCVYADRAVGAAAWDPATRDHVRRVARALTRGVVARRNGDAAPAAPAAAGAASAPPPAAPATPQRPAGAPPPSEPGPHAQAKGEAVLRVLRGEPVADVARDAGVSVDEVERWRRDFLDGAMARLGGG